MALCAWLHGGYEATDDADMEFDADEEQGLQTMVDRLIAAGIAPGGAPAHVPEASGGAEPAASAADAAAALKKRLGKELKEQAAGMVRKRCKKR